ncbi:phytoene desaturase family protein [Williamsia deligens]|uniref:Phytoene desaturase family protein n=1 Tax=Williamsia deligens TaxID=321325 RepID=A0ABW3GAA5_9NOCA|nr:phytoene desaturase family protein [Williamsia deligens]MCP2195851.1 phytoene desaturase [Williamsia deligens]
MSPRRVPGPVGHVVVVGAGLSGLAAALHLRGAGHEVTVVESAASPGGRVRTEVIDGIPFDTGASVLTMPGLIVRPMTAVGVDADEALRRLDLRPLDPTYHMRYADGVEFAVRRDFEDRVEGIAATFGAESADGYRRYDAWLRRLYEVEFDRFMDRNTDGILDYVATAEMRSGVKDLLTMGAVRRLTAAVDRFVHDERLQRAVTFQALYAGVPPSQAPAIYAVIAHMDVGLGVDYPIGGMGRVGAVMAQALTDAGGRVHYGEPVTSVRFSGQGSARRAVAVVTDGGEIACDAVVVTTDTPVTRRILGDTARRRSVRHSPSAVVAHITVDRHITASWPGGHHTIDFGAAWTDTFRQLTARRGSLMSDPSLLMNRPAVTDPDHFVTDGAESVSVLAPCPNLDSADLAWDALAAPYVAEYLGVLEDRGYKGISEATVHRIDHPGTWAADGMSAGTPFAAAHTLGQTGPLRTPNLWRDAQNVVLAGSSTVPGVGIPPVLVSGRLAAERITG